MSKRLYALLKRMLQKTFIPSGADLNDYLAPGKYYLGSLGNYTNAPSGYDTYSAYMKVHRQYNPASSNYTEQRLTLGSNYLTFVRRWNGTAWSTWVTYAGSRDLIVEQGTSGIWTYRKWASGLAECWTTTAQSATFTYSTTLFGGYSYYRDYGLPSGLFKSVTFGYCNGRTGSGIGFGYVSSYSTTTTRIYIVGNQKDPNVNRVHIHLKGTWK